MKKDFAFAGKTLRISATAENTVRLRLSDSFEPTLFERYGIFAPDGDFGEATENGIRCGGIELSFDGKALTLRAGDAVRNITLCPENAEADKKYFCEKLHDMRPDRKHILGADVDRRARGVDFHKAPKSITVSADSELFYGLGEGNFDNLVQNGRTTLGRVVYTQNEYPVPFLMSKKGWGMMLNTTYWHGVDICARNENEVCWYLPDGEIDMYFFGGDGLPALLERFTALTGRPALLPKWAYGLTFIEQYKADQFQVMNTAAKLRELKLPCDMMSLEPGWMEKEYDLTVNKQWNKDRFYICDWMRSDKPPRQAFTAALLRYGFKTQLWLCSNYDFTAEEENRAGNKTDFGFEPWFKHLKQFMNDGAASFKLDPHQVVDGADEERGYANGKKEPEMHNIMQTLYTKQLALGAREHTGRRNMHHFCGGYLGAAQYGAVTTGDSGGGLKTLAWSLNLGLSGVSNITCDMSIYSAQTIHYGFFTAWCQLNSWSGFSCPWWAGDDMQACFTYYDRLRYALMPYLYSAAIEANLTGMPSARAMPLVCDDEECADSITEYMFGDALLVGAFTDSVYLPAGSDWIDFWSGEKYIGGQTVSPVIPQGRGGFLFVRCGSIIPMQTEKQFTDCRDDELLFADVWRGGNGRYTLYEDDGLTVNGGRAATTFSYSEEADGALLEISPRVGSFDGMNPDRRYILRLHTPHAPRRVTVNGEVVAVSHADGVTSINAAPGCRVEIKY